MAINKEAEWSTAAVNNLPDSSFGWIQDGGKKDEEGKTTPRSLRHLPYKNASGTPDLAHVRNALARIGQVKGLPTEKKAALIAKFQRILKDQETENYQEYEEPFEYVDFLNNTDISIIEVLRIGKILDRDLTVTKEMLEQYVKNFQNNVYGSELQINIGHNREGEAAGWIKDLYVDGDTLMAKVEWTPLGREKIESKQFKFTSSELAPSWPDAKTGKKVRNVFIGAALTNIPAVKGMAPVSLSEKANIYLNQNNMKVLAKKFGDLMDKEKITKGDLDEFNDMMKKHLKDHAEEMEEADKKKLEDMASKVKDKYKDDGKEPDEAEEEEEEEEDSGTEKGKSKKLSEKKSYVSLAEFQAEKQKRIELEEKIARQELQERIEDELVLSDDREIGFVADEETLVEVTNFLVGLSEDKREEFFELMSLVKSVDLSIRGGLGVKVSKVKLSEENVVSLAETLLKDGKAKNISEAQKMAMQKLEKGE